LGDAAGLAGDIAGLAGDIAGVSAAGDSGEVVPASPPPQALKGNNRPNVAKKPRVVVFITFHL
jgi:hypothetical protein